LPDRRGGNPWTRIVWIVLGLLAGITVIGVLILQTLGPGAMIAPG
jgi:hypothetical protein